MYLCVLFLPRRGVPFASSRRSNGYTCPSPARRSKTELLYTSIMVTPIVKVPSLHFALVESTSNKRCACVFGQCKAFHACIAYMHTCIHASCIYPCMHEDVY